MLQATLQIMLLFMAVTLGYLAGALAAHRHHSFNQHPWLMRSVHMLKIAAVLTGYAALDPFDEWMWGALSCLCFAVLITKSNRETKKLIEAQKADFDKHVAAFNEELIKQSHDDAERR